MNVKITFFIKGLCDLDLILCLLNKFKVSSLEENLTQIVNFVW